MHDNNNELLPIVTPDGIVVGKATRGECHDGRSMLLHPVVHLHVRNSQGEVFLQHRPSWKTIQPNRWDTAVGGHVDFGETIEASLLREAREEIGLTDFVPRFLCQYVHESECERELVYVYTTTTNSPLVPSEELDGGRFFSIAELQQRMGQDFFTPNFESEWARVEKMI